MVRRLVMGGIVALGMMASSAMASVVMLEDVVVDPTKGTASAVDMTFVTNAGDAQESNGLSTTLSVFDGTGTMVGIPFISALMTYATGSSISQPITSINFLDLIFGAGQPFLQGTYLDEEVNVAAGTASLLFENDGNGSLAATFGDYFQVDFATGGTPFTDDGSTADTVSMTLTSMALVPIPLPAGAFLLIGGLGALGLFQRRRTA